MRILAISDSLFTRELAAIATEPALAQGHDVDLVEWSFGTTAAQQEQMLLVERNGPAAVPVPGPLARPYRHEVLVAQFTPISAEAIANGRNLRAILINRAGLENVDLDAAAARAVSVHNAPGRNARAVAEFTVGLILAEARNIARSHTLLKSGTWTNRFPNSEWTPELKDKLVGFVGYGRVARLVREMLAGFGCGFQAFDPHLAEAADVPLLNLDDLLRTSDVVTLHARLTNESRGLLGAREFSLMKPTAILVNTARAELVDEAALAAALGEGTLGGAAIDVFQREPPPPKDPIVTSERVTATPHLAGTTRDAFVTGPRMLAEILSKILNERGT